MNFKARLDGDGKVLMPLTHKRQKIKCFNDSLAISHTTSKAHKKIKHVEQCADAGVLLCVAERQDEHNMDGQLVDKLYRQLCT